MDLDYLFLRTLQDLRQKLKGDYYDKVKACGLLRKMFLDRNPLLHQINRKYRVDVTFRVINIDITNGFEDSPFMFINPEPHGKSKLINLTAFLSFKCMKMDNHFITIHDIIDAASHLEGGIHVGVPQNPKEKMMSFIFSYDDTHHIAIENICRISLSALQPLEDVINGHTPAGGISPQSSAS